MNTVLSFYCGSILKECNRTKVCAMLKNILKQMQMYIMDIGYVGTCWRYRAASRKLKKNILIIKDVSILPTGICNYLFI